MFSPLFYNTDDVFGHRRPQRQRYYHQGSVDEYLRRKEQEELEASYAQRRRRELYEQQLYEQRRQQAIAQRQKELMERKRRQRMLQTQMQAEAQNDDNDDYQIEIVRGRDGNLYYVKRPVKSRQKPKSLSTIIEENDHRPRRELKTDPTIEEESNSDSEADDEEYSNPRQRPSEFDELPRQLEPFKLRRNRRPSRKKSPKRRITVTVEDASDSECESEFDSPWRNRRPSPGQWMEPVDPFYG